MIKTATFNNVLFDIEINGPIDGRTDNPKGGKPTLVICSDLNKKVGLETAIHEALHACSFLKSEERVEQTAKDIARFLWNLDFRKVK